jgi:hypothetical protein
MGRMVSHRPPKAWVLVLIGHHHVGRWALAFKAASMGTTLPRLANSSVFAGLARLLGLIGASCLGF